MENAPHNLTNSIAEIKKDSSSTSPNKEDFLIYAKPFLTHIAVRDNYEKFLAILNRAGIKGIEEIIEKIVVFEEVTVDNSPEAMQGIINLFQKKAVQLQAQGAKQEEFVIALMETMSFENTTPLLSKTHNKLYDKYRNGFILFDRETAELSEEEEGLVVYFGKLIIRLFLQYLISHSAINEEYLPVFMKDLSLSYINSMETLYDETAPKELITFIEKIKIPNEEKLREKLFGTSPVIEIAPTKISTQKSETPIPQGLEFKTPLKEYSPKELRGLYDMNEKLFRSFINDNAAEIGQLGSSRIYTIKQVYTIFYLLGDPALKNKAN